MANKKWEDMTRAERRVAVCKEVISLLGEGRFRVRANTGYATTTRCVWHGPQETAKLAILDRSCTVCARGAMMLSKVAKFNHSDVLPKERCGLYEYEGYDTYLALDDCFNSGELAKIEHAFEVWDYTAGTPQHDFGAKHKNPRDRLLAIMQNIIDHKGEFKPEVEYEIVTE